jgi:hypothetical protein
MRRLPLPDTADLKENFDPRATAQRTLSITLSKQKLPRRLVQAEKPSPSDAQWMSTRAPARIVDHSVGSQEASMM